ncbi:DnaT-like ssDNA-binding domain-containing protein [Thalassolituus oleivorans]|uniref:DnaT-like ssDNA-binding domain-containing protein n=1 Tax=Thalassolituus oleivorans TaxID=187493 RepID=UPI001CE37E7B|nr:DnaT-like ssDNA-binding domain-containing protein [Thalassolituus oleivorans]MCA6128477.1 hypothetical protein [Thalassolituus oleivorans 4BN06-13]
MPSHPLFTDKTIALSATLAATIGLEEAVLLTILNDAASLQSNQWARLHCQTLRLQLPFWDDVSIRRVLRSLIDKGLLSLQGPMFPDAEGLIFGFGSQGVTEVPADTSTRAIQQPAQPSVQPANLVQPMPGQTTPHKPLNGQWQPNEDTLARLEQHGVPRAFSWAQMDAFILQGQEQGANRNDWNTRFFRHVKNQWVFSQNDAQKNARIPERTAFNPAQDEAKPIALNWQPSADACQILGRAGIDPQFIEDAVAEFILYWSERGDAFKTWNSKFIQHVRQQWARYTSAVEHSPLPSRIVDNWQPAADCFDILAMGHIPQEFAQNLVPEFVLYWRDSNQVHNSWNSRFLQYVKQQWGKRLAQPVGDANGQQTTAKPGYTTAEASIQRLNDTSW